MRQGKFQQLQKIALPVADLAYLHLSRGAVMIMYEYDADGLLIDPAGYTPQANPVRPDSPLMRPNSTELVPPEPAQRELVIFKDGAWSTTPDWRGFEYWLPDGSYHKIENYGVTPPAGHLTAVPPPTSQQLRDNERAWARSELARTDHVLFSDSKYSEADQNTTTAYRHALD